MATEEGRAEARGGVQLFWRYDAVPEGTTRRGLVVIVHGFAEHGGRYGHVVAAMTAAGFATLRLDSRGHGKSEGRRGFINRFAEYGHDVAAALDVAFARREGDEPVFLLGHSQGGLVVAHYLLEHARDDRPIAGAVLSSPGMGIAIAIPKWKEGLGQLMSSLWPPLSIPAGLPAEDVCRDPAEVKAYVDDPMVFTHATARHYTEFVATQQSVLATAGRLKTPLLVLQAGADKVVSPEAAERFFEAVGSEDKTYERLPGLYHEILNEPEKHEVIAKVVAWLEAHAG